MKQMTDDVHMLMQAWEQDTPTNPIIPDIETMRLRVSLIHEEYMEFLTATGKQDIVEIADAIIDLLVVITGTGIAMGLPMQALWDEVHRSNCTKLDPKTNKAIKNSEGKVVKPDTYSPPDLKKYLVSK